MKPQKCPHCGTVNEFLRTEITEKVFGDTYYDTGDFDEDGVFGREVIKVLYFCPECEKELKGVKL